MKTLRTICLTLTLLLGSVLAGCGPDFNKGVAAYESGDFATALGEFRPLAEQGVANAQYNLGVMYDGGEGVPQDYKSAVKWYTLAAEQGDAEAQFNLGNMYRKGEGVPKNAATAWGWYTLAELQGIACGKDGCNICYIKICDIMGKVFRRTIRQPLSGCDPSTRNSGTCPDKCQNQILHTTKSARKMCSTGQ